MNPEGLKLLEMAKAVVEGESVSGFPYVILVGVPILVVLMIVGGFPTAASSSSSSAQKKAKKA